jgi:hypothetical protein
MPVARFLATRVFCILGSSDGLRATAEEFGIWVKDLPHHFSVPGHSSSVRIFHSRDEVHEEPREEEIQSDSYRASSGTKRRKRGARKYKGKGVQAEEVDSSLNTLGEASQALAREIATIHSDGFATDPAPPSPSTQGHAASPTSSLTRKPLKWKLIFDGHGTLRSRTVPAPSPPTEPSVAAYRNNVTNFVMGLTPPPSTRQQASVLRDSTQSAEPFDDSAYTRGRRRGGPEGNHGGAGSRINWTDNLNATQRDVSPTSIMSWRTSSDKSSVSAFSRHSNSSTSTVATSVSGESWRNANGSKHSRPRPPPNVKCKWSFASFRFFHSYYME